MLPLLPTDLFRLSSTPNCVGAENLGVCLVACLGIPVDENNEEWGKVIMATELGFMFNNF